MRGFIERIRGREYQRLLRGDVIVEKSFTRQQVDYDEERVLRLMCRKGGAEVCFNDYLPDGWEFRERDTTLQVWEDFGRKAIWLPDSIAEEHLALTALLPSKDSWHDGSSEQADGHTFLLMKGAFFGLLHGISHVMEYQDIDRELFEDESRLRKMHETVTLQGFSEDDRERYMDLVFASEQHAWNHAFETLCAFRNSGLDLEPEVSDGELQLFAESCLKSYLM